MFTDADVVKRYIECRDWIEAEDKIHSERVKPVREAMQQIEGHLLGLLNERGINSANTDFGTFYRSTTLATRVADAAVLKEYVFENDRRDLLAAAVPKDAVKEFMDANDGHPPPGVEVSFVHKVNVRRS